MINKTAFLFMLICSIVFNLQAQRLLEHHVFNSGFNQNNEYSFKLELYPNGKYVICYGKEFGDDMFHYYEFLFGNYTVNNQNLTLVDEYTNLRLEYQYISDTVNRFSPSTDSLLHVKIRLLPIKTFPFLQNLTFTGNTITYLAPSSPYGLSSHIRKTRDKFKQSNSSQKLNIGNYKSTDRNVSVRLNIEKDKRYYLYSSKFLSSSGKWCKKGGKLILQDSMLNQEIYGLIGNNRIFFDTGYELQYVKE